MIGLGAGTAIYTVFAGFRGLAKSDAAEFGVSIVASVLLATFAIAGLPHGIHTLQGVQTASGRSVFDLWPMDDPLAPILLLAFGWWHSAPGKGALIQRVVASRDERSAMLTVATYAGLHYMLRPWAWYLIGAAALFYFPSLPKADAAMPELAASLLPDGLFGLIVVAATLAFMGCVNSRLNLGASYAVNDVATVLWPSLGDRNRRLVEIGVVALLMLLPVTLVVSGFSPGIRGLYQFLSMLVAGTGFVSIARWYWWRTSIVSEIASLFSAAIVAALSLAVADISRPTDFAVVLALNFVVGALATVVAAWVFGPSPDAVLRRFYDKVSPGGPGWRGFGRSSRSDLRRAALQWVLANLTLVAMVNACVRLVVADWIGAVASVACGLACLVALVGFVTRPNRPEQPGSTHPAAQS